MVAGVEMPVETDGSGHAHPDHSGAAADSVLMTPFEQEFGSGSSIDRAPDLEVGLKGGRDGDDDHDGLKSEAISNRRDDR